VENVFNWENVYAVENAAILEILLDRKVVPFCELVEIFFPNDTEKLDDYSYLINLIRPWEWIDALWGIMCQDILSFELPLSYFTKEYFYFWFCYMLQEYYIPNFGEAQLQVYTDKILARMIREGILPAEICRLPRLNKDSIGFTVIDNYYEKILDYNISSIDEIVRHEVNCSLEPVTLTYIEAIKRLEQNGCPKSLIEIYARQEKNSVYLQVADESINYCHQMRQFAKQSIEYFSTANCGNPFYKKRYRRLERLTQNTVDKLFNGVPIHIKNDISSGLKVQTTDIETKYHLERYIKSCVQIEENGIKKSSNVFQLKDTIYIQEDIEALIHGETHKAQASEKNEMLDPLGISINCLPTSSKEDKTITTQVPSSSKQKNPRSEQHPLFMIYAKNYARSGTFGAYSKMMGSEKYIFKSSGDYFNRADDDNTDNTDDNIKHVGFVHGTTKDGNPKFDIYYKPVLKDGQSLGKAKVISARCAETYFNPTKRKSHVNKT